MHTAWAQPLVPLLASARASSSPLGASVFDAEEVFPKSLLNYLIGMHAEPDR